MLAATWAAGQNEAPKALRVTNGSGEGFVRLGHLLDVVAPLHRRRGRRSIHDLVGEASAIKFFRDAHGRSRPTSESPASSTVGTNLDRYLVRHQYRRLRTRVKLEVADRTLDAVDRLLVSSRRLCTSSIASR
jgi:hypothetical protein